MSDTKTPITDGKIRDEKIRKVCVLIFAAVVAIGGTIVTSVIQQSYQGKLDDAQSTFAYLKTRLTQSDDQINLALSYGHHAKLLYATNTKASSDPATDAINAGSNAVSILADLNENETEELALQRIVKASPVNKTSCTGTQTNLDLTNTRDLRSLDLTSLRKLQACLNDQVERLMLSKLRDVDAYKGKVRLWGLIGTCLQFLGIGIAFLKDVF